jgi:YfiH family protein
VLYHSMSRRGRTNGLFASRPFKSGFTRSTIFRCTVFPVWCEHFELTMNPQFSSFPKLQNIPGLRHAITTRSGGTSGGGYASLNLGYHVGDDAAHVSENRLRLAAELGYAAKSLVAAQQVHGVDAHVVTDLDRGRGALDWESAIFGTDALITTQSQTPLLILVADCAPILIVDETSHALAVVHAGWRGAAGGIAGLTVAKLQRECGSQPEKIRAGIGPCLCIECLEIGEEVTTQVDAQYVRREAGWPKPHLDLRAMIAGDLERGGVAAENIEIHAACPQCSNDTYFSHRGQNGIAGRFGIVACWE